MSKSKTKSVKKIKIRLSEVWKQEYTIRKQVYESEMFPNHEKALEISRSIYQRDSEKLYYLYLRAQIALGISAALLGWIALEGRSLICREYYQELNSVMIMAIITSIIGIIAMLFGYLACRQFLKVVTSASEKTVRESVLNEELIAESPKVYNMILMDAYRRAFCGNTGLLVKKGEALKNGINYTKLMFVCLIIFGIMLKVVEIL